MTLDAHSTLGEWLDDDRGGPFIRDLLVKANVDETVLAPVRAVPVQMLVTLSHGALPQALVDELVGLHRESDAT